jgi:hypothetical protein
VRKIQLRHEMIARGSARKIDSDGTGMRGELAMARRRPRGRRAGRGYGGRGGPRAGRGDVGERGRGSGQRRLGFFTFFFGERETRGLTFSWRAKQAHEPIHTAVPRAGEAVALSGLGSYLPAGPIDPNSTTKHHLI